MAIDDELEGQHGAAFVADPRSVAEARGYVRQTLDGLRKPVVDTAMLLVSELATNCVRYARTPYAVKATVAGDVVRVDVTDTGGGFPRIIDPQPAIGGLGLRMVDQEATRWGTRQEDDETTVWFELGP